MNKIENEPKNSTKKIKRKLIENVEKNMSWTRDCPKCKKILSYSYKQSYDRAVKRNQSCINCRPKWFGTDNSNYKGVMDKSVYYRDCPSCGKRIEYTSFETYRKAKLRNYGCGCITKNSWACYNPDACKLFDEINQELGWNGQHALNGGERRVSKYWVDFYEPTHNIVIEYDERWHKYRQNYDMNRQREIEQYLGCKFYRIKEGQDWKQIIQPRKIV